MAKTELVTAAKPKVGGAVSTAVAGTRVPTDATSALSKAFKGLGYISEDGLTNAGEMSSETLKAWGGDVVNSVQTEKSDTFTYKLIESLNIDVLKEVYGDENVTGDLDAGITVKVNSKELPEHPVVIDVLLKGGVFKRIVIPKAKISEIGEITYQDADNVGYEVTLQALPDEEGNTHYEYIKKATAASTASSVSPGG